MGCLKFGGVIKVTNNTGAGRSRTGGQAPALRKGQEVYLRGGGVCSSPILPKSLGQADSATSACLHVPLLFTGRQVGWGLGGWDGVGGGGDLYSFRPTWVHDNLEGKEG